MTIFRRLLGSAYNIPVFYRSLHSIKFKGVYSTVDRTVLNSTFEKIGPCVVDFRPKLNAGCAFIDFEDSKSAIAMLNDKRDRGYELKPSDRSFSNTLFAGFDRGVAHTFQELYDEASQYGKVKNIRFKPTNPTKFCFVDCLTNEARDKALVALADLKNAGFKVNVSLPAEKEGSESDFERNKRLLYVGRSEPLDMKELSKTLHKTIGPHAILTGQSKLSFGFVHYEVKEDAERAITELDGLSFQGAKMYVEKYIPQEEFNRIKEPFPKENSEF